MTEVEDISIVQMGWGVKQGGNVKNWKRRWFVLLSNGNLRYFVDKLAVDEQGHVEIKKQTQNVFLSPTVNEGIPITIVLKDRNFMIAFPTREEAEQWNSKINELKNTLP